MFPHVSACLGLFLACLFWVFAVLMECGLCLVVSTLLLAAYEQCRFEMKLEQTNTTHTHTHTYKHTNIQTTQAQISTNISLTHTQTIASRWSSACCSFSGQSCGGCEFVGRMLPLVSQLVRLVNDQNKDQRFQQQTLLLVWFDH